MQSAFPFLESAPGWAGFIGLYVALPSILVAFVIGFCLRSLADAAINPDLRTGFNVRVLDRVGPRNTDLKNGQAASRSLGAGASR